MKDGQQLSGMRVWLWGYLLLTITIGMLQTMMIFGTGEYTTAARLIFLAVFVLTLKRWTGAVLFCFCQAHLLFMEPRSREPQFYLDIGLWGLLAIALLGVLSRYRTLQERDAVAAHRSLYAVYHDSRKLNVGVLSDHVRAFFGQTLRFGGLIFLSSIIAWWFLGSLPGLNMFDEFQSRQDFALRASGLRLLTIFLSGFCGVFVIWLFINEIVWRNTTPTQAKVFLNSVLLKTFHRDLRPVAKGRIKAARRRQGRKPKLDSDEDIERLK